MVFSSNKKFGNKTKFEGDFEFSKDKVANVLLIYDGYEERLILKNNEN